MLHRAAVLAACSLIPVSATVAQCASPPMWSQYVGSTETANVITADGAGGLFAGGMFTSIGGTAAARIARWNGTSWSALGTGISGGAVPTVYSLLRTSTGQLIAGGSFTTAGGVTVNHVARWNGTSWSALGTGVSGFLVNRIAELANGDIVICGNFSSAGGVPATNIARWNGASWSALGGGVTSPGGILRLANGDLIAGGSIAGVTGFVGRWNGTSWSSVGNLGSMVPNAFAELPNGDVLGVGYQTVQRWNGTSWSVAGTLSGGNITTAYDAVRHPDGSAIVVGAFSTVTAGVATAVRGVARYEPLTGTWSDIGSASALNALGNGGLVGDALVLDDGRLLLAQNPGLLGAGAVSVLGVMAGCPPANSPYGAGCAGSGGLNVLTATAQPWLGTAMTANCTGLPSVALSVGVWGLSATNVPLSTILGQALPGCTFLAFPDALTAHVPVAGVTTASLPLPLTSSLAGSMVRLQVVTFEANGDSSSSNGVEFVLGRF